MRQLLLIGLILILTGCGPDEDYQPLDTDMQLQEKLISLYGNTNELLLPSSNSLDEIPADPNNPLSNSKILLGKLLFHETAIALSPKKEISTGTYSCASCHHSKAGFQSGVIQGIAEGGAGFGLKGENRILTAGYDHTNADIQPIRSPTVLNTAFQEVMLWNGQFGGVGINKGTETEWTEATPKATNKLGFEGLETQAIAGLKVHRLEFDSKFIEDSPYKTLFDQAFPHLPVEARYTVQTAGLAIAAYERVVLSNKAPFQEWLKGNALAMDEESKKGALLFFGKAQCFECHSGPALNSMTFHAIGMKDLDHSPMIGTVDEATRKGRGGFTKNPADDYTFKTPTLYNLKDHNFFGHGSSFRTIREVLEYKNRAIAENGAVPKDKLSPLFTPLDLSAEDLDMLEAFLTNGLYDPDLDRYVPDEVLSGHCFPNSDEDSMKDLGCDA